MAEQAQALKAEAPAGRDVCLVSNRVWPSFFAYPWLLFVMDYKLGRIYAKTNAALVDRPRKSSIKSLLLFPVPHHAQIQSIPGLVGDPQCYFLSQLGLGTRLSWCVHNGATFNNGIVKCSSSVCVYMHTVTHRRWCSIHVHMCQVLLFLQWY